MKKNLIFLSAVFFVVFLGACQNKKPPAISSTLPQHASGLKTVYFDYDMANIRSDQISVIDHNGEVLKSNPNVRVTIEGHCDERGTNEYNMALGDRRAQTVKDYLINSGIDPSRMGTVSYGEERPVSTCSDESCWSQNRRAEFMK